MLFLPDELLLMCIPPFDNFVSFPEFLKLRLVNRRFNFILRSEKFWNFLSKSQTFHLCKLLSVYWYGLKYLKLENPLEEINTIPRFDKYSIPGEVKQWLTRETRLSLALLIKIINRTGRRRIKFRLALIKKEMARVCRTKEAEPNHGIEVRHQCTQAAISSHLGGFEEIEMTIKVLEPLVRSDPMTSVYLQVLRHTHTYGSYNCT